MRCLSCDYGYHNSLRYFEGLSVLKTFILQWAIIANHNNPAMQTAQEDSKVT